MADRNPRAAENTPTSRAQKTTRPAHTQRHGFKKPSYFSQTWDALMGKRESVRRLRKESWGKTSVFDWAAFQSPRGSSYFLLKKNKTSEPRHHNHIQPACPIQKSILSFHEAVHPKPNRAPIPERKATPLTRTVAIKSVFFFQRTDRQPNREASSDTK